MSYHWTTSRLAVGIARCIALSQVASSPFSPAHGLRSIRTFHVIRRHAGIMLAALIAPELVILWAMRQFFHAGNVVNKFNDELCKGNFQWSRTREFFVMMGGLVDHKDDLKLYDEPLRIPTFLPITNSFNHKRDARIISLVGLVG
ncbi:uncharacterized protein BJ212DRAFT_1484385 [Suillus subaureus]|uniref:Uncharacterized protein n=1 Tax=Suillus subaureus TaxID=48587 RepID=A0A9P7J9I1_9AGAM|nr:uncharacterized protein BJ212DRAFT_1484385 [Suillus subaureus]KAG1809688.1 hypothetical protein BJ212DRAFT_1484385 [Suillus subaureus]